MSVSNDSSTGNSVPEPANLPPMTERLNVEELTMKRKPRPIPVNLPEPLQPSVGMPASRPETTSSTEQILKLAAYAISARALLLLALIGAFVLAVMAMATESLMRLYVLVAYCVLVVAPIVALEIRKR